MFEVAERLVKRPPDEEAKVRDRLREHYGQEEALKGFYGERALLIDGDGDPHTVFEAIESRIVTPLPRNFGLSGPLPSAKPGSAKRD